MCRHFLQGMKGAEDDMKGKPGEQQPTSPIVAEEKEDAAEHGQKANGRDENDIAFERPMREVISKAHAARQGEQDAEDRDWPGSFHDRKAGFYAPTGTGVHLRLSEARSLSVPAANGFVGADGDEPGAVG